VGPESAGADPGPICYGKGTLPTVTDANLILGRLRPENFLGGEFRLDVERTRALFKEWIQGQQLSWSAEELAAGIVRVINATMEKAIRVVSVEQGYDPRDFSLLAFGGAGALHACELAASLSIPRVIVPPAPGALSAYGILVSDVVKDFSRTSPLVLSRENFSRDLRRLQKIFEELKEMAAREYETEKWKGKPRLEFSIDMRYQGQGYELRIPWRRTAALIDDFHAAHQRRFGYQHGGKNVEAVTLRVRATLPQHSSQIEVFQRSRGSKVPERKSQARFGTKAVACPILVRESLPGGFSVSGPAIVAEYTATTVVLPGWRLSVHRSGALLMEAQHKTSRRHIGKNKNEANQASKFSQNRSR
jgi:N-methylhydantoinase A